MIHSTMSDFPPSSFMLETKQLSRTVWKMWHACASWCILALSRLTLFIVLQTNCQTLFSLFTNVLPTYVIFKMKIDYFLFMGDSLVIFKYTALHFFEVSCSSNQHTLAFSTVILGMNARQGLREHINSNFKDETEAQNCWDTQDAALLSVCLWL